MAQIASRPQPPADHAAAPDEARFDRGAWLLLLFAFVFLALDVAQVVYRFTLPTEGWAVDTNALGADFPMAANLVGAPSRLQPGDALERIGDLPASLILAGSALHFQPPAGWVAGGHVPVTVLRHGQPLSFDLPIVHWTPGAWLRANFLDLGSALNWLTSTLLLAVGLFTVLQRPGNFAARFLFLFGLASAATIISDSLPDTVGAYFNLTAVLSRALFSNVIFAYLFGPALLGFALTFPQPKAWVRRRPLLLVTPFAAGLVTPALLFTAPELAVIGFPLTLGMLLAAIGALLHSGLTMRSAVSRAQMRWVIGGGVVGLGLFTLNFGNWPSLVPAPIDVAILFVASLGPLVLGLALAVAILRYRLFEIDVLIRRTLIYAVLTSLLALTYLGSVVVLQNLFSALTGQRASTLVTVLSTLGIAALFGPLRRWVQASIDRRFYRRRYDAARTLAVFGAALRDEVELEALREHLLAAVDETLQPESMGLVILPAAAPPAPPPAGAARAHP